MTIAGFKAYLTDGSIMRTLEWAELPDIGIQIITVYYAETFPIHVNRGELGQVVETWNRKEVLQGFDYYWRLVDQFGERYGCTDAADIPDGATVKRTGEQLDNEAWLALYNRALNDEVW